MTPLKDNNDIRFAVLAADTVCFRIIDKELYILLGKTPASSPYPNIWALIGGLIRPKETADEAVTRLLQEKAGIEHIYTEQIYTFSAVDRDPRGRVVSVAFSALTHEDPQDIEKAVWETKWCSVKNMPTLAYDHNQIVERAIERLNLDVRSTNCIQYLLPKEFTLSELQSAYEVVIGESVDKRNFRKKILASDMLTDTKRTKKQGVMRPASLFIFKEGKKRLAENL